MASTFATDHALHLVTKPAYGYIPMGSFEYACTPCRIDRGTLGMDEVFVARRRAARGFEYAVLVTCSRGGGTVRAFGSNSAVPAENRREPMLDASAVERAAVWGPRANAVAIIANI